MKKIPKYGTLAWRIYQYEQAKIARRGRNYKYMTGNESEILEARGYIEHEEKVQFASTGQEIVKRLRGEGYYAKMLLLSTRVRGCPDIYIFKKKKSKSL